MRKNYNFIWVAAVAMMAAVSSCSVKENPADEPVAMSENKVMTLVVTLEQKTDPDTRSVMTDNGTTISTAWEVGDKVWVNYDDTGDNNVVATGTVTAVDGAGKATITVDLVNPKDASIIVFGFPYDHWTEVKDVRVDQVGTLADINMNHAAISGSGTLTVVGSDVTLPGSVSMNQEMAIWKLNFKDGGTDITSQVTSLNISFGPYDDYMITPNAQSDIYVALYPVAAGDITIAAATATGNYSYSKSGVTLDNGKFYRSQVSMSAAAASNTYRVFTTRTAYSDEAIPIGATIVGNSATAVTWTSGTYVVNSNVTIDGGVTLAGDVDLILCDGVELTITNGHIVCPQDEGNTWDYLYSINIYGQALSTGKLTVVHNNINIQAHNLNIHGGTITVTDGGVMQGIEFDETFNIYHGTINAHGEYGGIISLGNMFVHGGTINASSNDNCAAIMANNDLTIAGGVVNAQCANQMEGIAVYGSCIMTGGNVTAKGGAKGGIGFEGVLTISGGVLETIGGNGIDDEYGKDGAAGYDGTLNVTGGKLIATGGAKYDDGMDGVGISDGSTIALIGVTMYEGDSPNPATPAADQSACTKRYVKIQ